MKPVIAFLVSHNYDDTLRRTNAFKDEHQVLKPYFASLGYELEKLDWQSTQVDWSRFKCILPKAVWNYFDETKAFKTFLKKLQEANIPVRNPIESILWNMHKGYLLEIQKKGKPVVPLALYKKGEQPEEKWFSQFNCSEVLVKPSMSAGSKNTIQFKANSWQKEKATFDLILEAQDLIVQPFASEVQDEGEYSFFFFENRFSHAILKKPHVGDFRAHSFFGAVLTTYNPSANEINLASEFLDCCPTPCPYARIDLVRFKGTLSLIELEIIEPYLYLEFSKDENSCKNFAKAIVNSIK